MRAKGVAAHLVISDRPTPCFVENISTGGVFIRTTRVLPQGSPVSLMLALVGTQVAVTLAGRVVNAVDAHTAAVRTRQPGMGVEFSPPGKEDAEKLAVIIREMNLAAAAKGLTGLSPTDPTPVAVPQRPVLTPSYEPQTTPSAPIPVRAAQSSNTGSTEEVRLLRAEIERLKIEIRNKDELLAKFGFRPRK